MKTARAFAVAFLLVVAAVSTAYTLFRAGVGLGSGDFGITWFSAKILRETDVYRMYLDHLPHEPFVRPLIPVQAPSALMLLWPYTFLSWPTARLVWLVSNLFFTAGFLWLAFRRFLPRAGLQTQIIVSCLFLISLPWRTLIRNGQHLMASLFFMMLALWLFERRRSIGSGVALALSFFKYTAIFPLLPFLLRKKAYLSLCMAFVIHGIMTAAVGMALGVSPITLVLESLEVASELETTGYLDLFAIGIPPLLSWVASGILLVSTVLVAVFRPGLDDGFVMAILALIASVVVYHQYYDYVLLIFPLLYAVRNWRTDRITCAIYGLLIVFAWYVTWVLGRVSIAMGGPSDLRDSLYSQLLAGLWYGAILWSLGRAFFMPRQPDPASQAVGAAR